MRYFWAVITWVVTTATSLELSRTLHRLVSYLAENVDGVSSPKRQLVRMVRGAIPQALEVVHVVCGLVYCCRGT